MTREPVYPETEALPETRVEAGGHPLPIGQVQMPHHYLPVKSSSATYSLGVEVSAPSRWLYISGQVPRHENGDIPEGIEAQAELVWSNLAAALNAGGMSMDDLVDLTIYLVDRSDGPIFDRIRAKWLDGAKPCSTKIFVSGFVDLRMLCELQAHAAR